MVLSPAELLDMVLMTIAVAYIFMDFFKVPRVQVKGFDWNSFWMACAVTAPAVILHELGHKFTAIAFGAQATFHAAYLFLAVGVVLKLVRSPFIFFVPGYVSIPAALPLLPMALVAFAGPAVNGILWIAAVLLLDKKKDWSNRNTAILVFTRKINGFLFILNMIPIPGFDGYKVFAALFGLF